ncbi:MAG: transketolase, partial [Nitrosarchaeum sp.]|nr:transketolase [Nitrosarchaeum sp.]
MGLNYYQIKKNILRARKLVIKATNSAGSGHPGGSFSMAEILGCLFYKHLQYDPKNPQWDDRDRLILSKGHAAPGLFSNMAVAGYFPESELETLRKFGSKLQGHPDLKCPGVEFCGGSLGTGLSYSVGVALAAKIDGKNHHVYTIMGDGETDEGQVWEALNFASYYELDNLIVIADINRLGQSQQTMFEHHMDEYVGRFRAFGAEVLAIDGHNLTQIDKALADATQNKTGKPYVIVAKTFKGRGVSFLEDNDGWHGKPLKKEDLEKALKELGEVDEGLRFQLKKPQTVISRSKATRDPNEISRR